MNGSLIALSSRSAVYKAALKTSLPILPNPFIPTFILGYSISIIDLWWSINLAWFDITGLIL